MYLTSPPEGSRAMTMATSGAKLIKAHAWLAWTFVTPFSWREHLGSSHGGSMRTSTLHYQCITHIGAACMSVVLSTQSIMSTGFQTSCYCEFGQPQRLVLLSISTITLFCDRLGTQVKIIYLT